MRKLFMGTLVTILLLTISALAQNQTTVQGASVGQDKGTQQPPVTPAVLAAYAKWRTDTLLNYPQGLLTQHYAIAIVAQRLDDSTAQVEVLLAADMKHYTVTIRPVTLTRLASGETATVPSDKAVTIDQKASEKVGNSPEATRLGQTMTLVPISKGVHALEITWEPKNDRKDDPSNTCIIQLGKEPTVTVNGYIIGAPVK